MYRYTTEFRVQKSESWENLQIYVIDENDANITVCRGTTSIEGKTSERGVEEIKKDLVKSFVLRNSESHW